MKKRINYEHSIVDIVAMMCDSSDQNGPYTITNVDYDDDWMKETEIWKTIFRRRRIVEWLCHKPAAKKRKLRKKTKPNQTKKHSHWCVVEDWMMIINWNDDDDWGKFSFI